MFYVIGELSATPTCISTSMKDVTGEYHVYTRLVIKLSRVSIPYVKVIYMHVDMSSKCFIVHSLPERFTYPTGTGRQY